MLNVQGLQPAQAQLEVQLMERVMRSDCYCSVLVQFNHAAMQLCPACCSNSEGRRRQKGQKRCVCQAFPTKNRRWTPVKAELTHAGFEQVWLSWASAHSTIGAFEALLAGARWLSRLFMLSC